MSYHDIKSVMLRPGETVYEASRRIDTIRELRAQRHAPVDKLAERDRLTRYWKAAYPQWQPELCRIDPNFALVHVASFRRGMLHGRLSLLPGHVPPHIARQRAMSGLRPAPRAQVEANPPAQGDLFEITP
jgi:hypothetical protein